MSIATVRQAAEAIVVSVLGDTFKPLPFAYDVDKNDERALENGYAVTVGEATPGTVRVDQRKVLEQELFVDITSRVYVRNDDSKSTASIDAVLAYLSTIINQFWISRLGVPATVLKCEIDTVYAPGFVNNGRDIVKVKARFLVNHVI